MWSQYGNRKREDAETIIDMYSRFMSGEWYVRPEHIVYLLVNVYRIVYMSPLLFLLTIVGMLAFAISALRIGKFILIKIYGDVE